MKILYSVPRYHPNHDGMVAGLLDAGHQPSFLVRSMQAQESHRPGVPVTMLGGGPAAPGRPKRVRGLVPAFRFAHGFLRRTRPDLVIARNADSTSYAVWLACRLLGIDCLLYVQSRTGYERMGPGRRLRLRLGLWPRHTVNATDAAPSRPIAGKTLDFLPFAVEIVGPEKTDYPAGRPVRALAVAKLDGARKNLAPMVRCLAPALRAGGLTLTLAGLNEDPGAPAFRGLVAEIERQGVGGAVAILQNLDYPRARRLYAEHDLFLLASSREMAAISPGEAMAAGLPVIVGADNGANYLVLPGETGVVFPDGDFDALAATVARLARDPAEIARMGRNARRRIAADFSPAAYERRLMAIVARRFPRRAAADAEGCG